MNSWKYIVRYKTHEFFPSLFQAVQHFIQRHAVQLNHFIKFAHQHQSTSTIKLHLLFNETLHLQNTYQIHKKLLRFENRHISIIEIYWKFHHFIEYIVWWELVSFLFQQMQIIEYMLLSFCCACSIKKLNLVHILTLLCFEISWATNANCKINLKKKTKILIERADRASY